MALKLNSILLKHSGQDGHEHVALKGEGLKGMSKAHLEYAKRCAISASLGLF
ncbi:MAG: hypothetical protein ACUVTD_09155 [Nitrososphaerales archaeon]